MVLEGLGRRPLWEAVVAQGSGEQVPDQSASCLLHWGASVPLFRCTALHAVPEQTAFCLLSPPLKYVCAPPPLYSFSTVLLLRCTALPLYIFFLWRRKHALQGSASAPRGAFQCVGSIRLYLPAPMIVLPDQNPSRWNFAEGR